jgi:hypothetical protein
MNLSEVIGCLCFLFFGLIGCLLGLDFGIVAGVGGSVVGALLGFYAGILGVEVYSRVAIAVEVRARRSILRKYFGNYYSSSKSGDWESARQQFRLGTEVNGRVVNHLQYGVVLDIGSGFPAILTSLRFSKPFSENPPEGELVSARVEAIDDQNHEFELTQRHSQLTS